MSNIKEERSRIKKEYVSSRAKAKGICPPNSNETKATNRQKPKRRKR